MNVTVDEVIIWLVIGLVAGSLVGALVTRQRRGFGLAGNLLVGLAGAVLGGFAFDASGINLGLGRLTVEYGDLLAAAAGATVISVGVLLLQRARRSEKEK